MRKSPKGNGLQYPARHLDHPPAADRHLEGKRMLRISDCIRPLLWNRLDLSIYAYSCRSLSRNELINRLFQEVGITSCNILLVCKRRRKVGHNLTWNGDSVLVGAGQGWKSVDGIEFVVSMKWSSEFLSVSLVANRFASRTKFQPKPQGRPNLCLHLGQR